MSYSLIGHFVNKKDKNEILMCDLDYLKNLQSRRYSSCFTDIVSTSKESVSDYEDIKTFKVKDFHGYYKKAILDDNELVEKLNIEKEDGSDEYVITCVDISKELEEKLKSYSVMNIQDEEYITLLFVKDTNVSGTFYTFKDFEDAKPIIEKRYNELGEQLRKLKEIRESIEWYKLDSEARDELEGDLSEKKDLFEDASFALLSLNKIIDVFSFMNNDIADIKVDKFGCKSVDWSYNGRDVELFIEVD